MIADLLGRENTIVEIEYWIKSNHTKFQDAVYSSECGKWEKWLMKKEKPFPCVCPIRNQDCVFAELYYKLSNTMSIKSLEDDCIYALAEINHSKNWIKNNTPLFNKLIFYKRSIKIKTKNELHDFFEIKISLPQYAKDFKSAYLENKLNN